MRNFLISICVFTFFACGAQKWSATTQSILIKNQQSDAEMEQLIAPYKEKVDKEIVVIGKACTTLYAGKPESPLSNFAADALLRAANSRLQPEADFSIINVGGLRIPIEQGEITRLNLFEIMPFENELVILTLRGNDVNTLLQQIADMKGEGVSGLRMLIENQRPENVLINGKEFDANRTYRIATSDFMACGKDGLTILKEAVETESTGLKIRELLIDAIEEETRAGSEICPSLDGRIIIR